MQLGKATAPCGRKSIPTTARINVEVCTQQTFKQQSSTVTDRYSIRHSHICRAKGSDDEPDWDKEMSIFAKRASAPNQLATIRELESKMNVGKVLFVQDSLAIVTGLNADAPVGTKLSFVTGATGVLLWHRSDNLAFVLILGGAPTIQTGTGLQCNIKGVLQVIDDVKGPITKKEYELFEVPVGDHLLGKTVNFLCQPIDGPGMPESGNAKAAKAAPLLSTHVQIKQREQVNEGLQTGVRALDLLTPLGKGASLLIIGPNDSGKSTVVEDAVLGQKGTGVVSVYASTNRSLTEVKAMQKRMADAGALPSTCIVACSNDAPLGEKFATICAAYTVAEAVRDKGGHSLVLVDDLNSLSDLWNTLAITGLGSLGRDMARQGLIKDSQGHDVNMPDPTSDDELVDYEGMLVSGAVAQRRGFFSTLFQRSAKLAKGLGGGTLSSLLVVPGRPATGVTKKVDMSKYQTLSEEQKAKIKAVLEAKLAEELSRPGAPGELDTEAVEEFISIADGQLVLESKEAGEAARVNPKLSITRIGSRAYPKALEQLAPQIRLNLTQAEDARKFNLDAAAQVQKEEARASRMAAALTQQPGNPTNLEEQVVLLLAIQKGYADNVAPDQIPEWLTKAFKFVKAAAPSALSEVRNTRMLTATAEKGIFDALRGYNDMLAQK